MKILITGGAGYIGYSLVQALEERELVDEIIVYDNFSHHDENFFFYGKPLQKTKIVSGDILNSYELQKQVDKADVVYHLAAEVRFPYSHDDHSKYEQINQYGTLNLYQTLRESAVKKVIYVSSAAVYGFREIPNESTPPTPDNAYGASKLEGEKYLQNLKKQDVIIFRASNVFGLNPCLRKDAVIHKFMLEALVFGKISIYGNGDQKRAYIHLPLLIKELVNGIENECKPGIYNLVQGNLTLNDIRDVLLEEMPDLEFSYLSYNSNYKSISMNSDRILFEEPVKDSIRRTFQILQNQYRIN